jgi:DNA-binding winged helix-turn-helix (wHTH) protein
MQSQSESQLSFRAGPYVVDGRAREMRKGSKRIPLSGNAFEVLYQLVGRRGNVIYRHEFKPWERQDTVDQRTPLGMAIVEIRRRLGKSFIQNVRGKGYRLSSKYTVEVVSSPSLSGLERQMNTALDQISDHTEPSLRAAIENCEELLKTDKIQDAYAVLALAHINRGHVGFCREMPDIAIRRARKVVDEALEWFPTFGSAYALRGLAALIYDYDWKQAEADLLKALEYSPRNEFGHGFLSHLRVAQGEFDEGLEHARIAAEVDYDSPMTVVTEPWLMMFAGRLGEAVNKGEEVVKRFGQSAPAHSILGHAYRAAGAREEAIKQFDLALGIEFIPETAAALGFIHGQKGNRKKALASLNLIYEAKKKNKIAYVSSYFEALVYTGLGEKRKALDALDKAFKERCDWLIHLAVEPRWETLRGEKRFVNLMRRVGLQPKHT